MKRRKPETIRERWAYFWKYRLPMYMWDTDAGTIVFCWAVLIAAFGLGMLIFWAVGLLRPAEGENPSAKTPAVVRYLSAPDAEEIRTAVYFDTYTEGDGPAPAWYRPTEPMAAEWEDSKSDPTRIQPESNPIQRTDAGCPNYSIEPEVVPDWILDVPLDRWFQEYLHDLCEAEGVPYLLAVAVIEAESGYDPGAVSVCGDYGLMQINEICHGWLGAECGVTNFLDPWQNVRAGVRLLGMYWQEYGAESGTLMAYNMGREAAEALFARGIYATDYSARVMGIRGRLEAENG